MQLNVLLKESFPVTKVVTQWIFDAAYSLEDNTGASMVQELVQDKSWYEVDWQVINGQVDKGWMTPSYLNIGAYQQLFPSFLLYCLENKEGVKSSLLSELFIEWHLNMGNAQYEDNYEDRKAFIFSLSKQQKNCIGLILLYLIEHNPEDYALKEALESYWVDYL